MRFDLITTRERGKVIPEWRYAGNVRIPVRVAIEQRFHPDLRRYMMVAVARDLGRNCPIVELLDSTLVDLTPDHIVLRGFERIDDGLGGFCDYVQSWVLLPRDE